MNIPNMLTLFRLFIALIIGFPFLFLATQPAAMVAFVLFVMASLTDFLDGYLARKWNQVSELGRMLDPIADKVMVLMVLALILAVLGIRPFLLLPIALIFFREVCISGMREYLGDRAKQLKVTRLAKWKTATQMVAISVMLFAIGTNINFFAQLGVVLLWAAMFLTVITGLDYAKKTMAILEN